MRLIAFALLQVTALLVVPLGGVGAALVVDGNLQEWTWQDRIDVIANLVVPSVQLFGRFESTTGAFSVAVAVPSSSGLLNGTRIWLNTDDSFTTSAPIWSGVSSPLVGGADLYALVNPAGSTCTVTLYNANTNAVVATTATYPGLQCASADAATTLEVQLPASALALSGAANMVGQRILGLLVQLTLAGGTTQYVPTSYVASQSYWLYEATSVEQLAAYAAAKGTRRRVGIVYANATARRFYDLKSYSQLFQVGLSVCLHCLMLMSHSLSLVCLVPRQAAQHQVMMAGIPFDLLTLETDCLSVAAIAQYDTLVMPMANCVPTASVATISECCVSSVLLFLPFMVGVHAGRALIDAVYRLGIGVISSGDFVTSNEAGVAFAAPYSVQQQLFGLVPLPTGAFGGPANFTVLATAAGAAHPVLSVAGFTAGETIIPYVNGYYSAYAPASATNPAAYQATLLAQHASTNKPIIYAVRMGLAHGGRGARMVHYGTFNMLGDRNTLWSAVRWSVFGDSSDLTPALVSSPTGLTVAAARSTLLSGGSLPTVTPMASVTLQLGRQTCVVAARCDADDSQYSDDAPMTEELMTPTMEQWKLLYDYVSTDYINVGSDPADQMSTNWTEMGPMWRHLMELGHEIGTHSTTHPDYVDTLTPAQLVSEFGDSQTVLTQELFTYGAPSTYSMIVGMAIPGNPETINTDACIARTGWFDYISGTIAIAGNGFQSAFGWLWPNTLADRAYAPSTSITLAITGGAPTSPPAPPPAPPPMPGHNRRAAAPAPTTPPAPLPGTVSQIAGSTSHLVGDSHVITERERVSSDGVWWQGMIYLNMNMYPDFTLVEFYNYTAARTQATWLAQLALVLSRASTPIVHWVRLEIRKSLSREAQSLCLCLAHTHRCTMTMASTHPCTASQPCLLWCKRRPALAASS
jgi:serralysin